jgi:hypothetical protein
VNWLKMMFKLALFHGVVNQMVNGAGNTNQMCLPVYPMNLIGSKRRHVLKAERRQALLFALSPPRRPRLRSLPRKEYLGKNTHIVFHLLSD